MKYDFAGWATKNNIKCSDGRTILKDAFKEQDGAVVPLVWNHEHGDPFSVLGKALLHNREDGVYAYCLFNDTEAGQAAKALVNHGDVDSLSICAGHLKHTPTGGVMHGRIREVSLVLTGANEGAKIESVISHGEEEEELAYIHMYDDADELVINHSGEEVPEKPKEDKKEMAEPEKKNDKTVQDVIDSMTEEQRTVLYALVGQALSEDADDYTDEEESDNMKHNVFENDNRGDVLTHSDFEAIKANAKRCGSWKDAFNEYTSEMMHGDEIDLGDETDSGGPTLRYEYGIDRVDLLFPDARNQNIPPEFIKRDTDWVSSFLGQAKHSPFSRIKSSFANITEDEARAKGYIQKGKVKKEEFFSLAKRSTTPTTIYKKQKMDRDDVIDITDFDVVAWLKREMRIMLDEELARAALVGDGRTAADEDKISEEHIRPIAKDSPLFTIYAGLIDFMPSNAEHPTASDVAKGMIRAVLNARAKYKGSGTPTLYTSETLLTNMLLLTDDIGRDLYDSVEKLATKMRVKNIVTVPVFDEMLTGEEGLTNIIYGIVINPADYTFGADKGGAVSLFEDFDIDVNQQKYLIETRCSGCLTKPFSAICITALKNTFDASPKQIMAEYVNPKTREIMNGED